MPKDNQSDPRKNFVPRFLPWLLGGVMLALYWATLDHWVTLLNVNEVAVVSGWTWRPQIFGPLTFLAGLPFRWLPAAQIPAALNFFSALCAAATLVVLARSVAILPHDRTDMERTRERSDFSFLTGWVAWIPPITAVIFAGAQLTFWQNATSYSGASFQLLWFAVILWQLLEYRLDEWEGRLLLTAVLYGAGLAEDWALVAFFPVFLTMIIWLRKLDFFNLNFLLRMTLCGLAGALTLLLLPVIAKLSSPYPLTLWDVLKPNLRSDWSVIKSFQVPLVRNDLGLISLTSLVPAFVMSIRWSSSFGDSSRMGAMLVNYMMHLVNAVLFGLLVWAAFDPPFSAHQLAQEVLPNVPALTLIYLAALCIGYYCGYALLIFGKKPIPTRRNSKPDPALPKSWLWLRPLIVAGTLTIIVLATALLFYKNTPLIRAVNDDSLLKYAQSSLQNLPPEGAILLCDSDDLNQDLPLRAFLMQAALAREGRMQNYPVVDTQSLSWAPYHDYLHKNFPRFWPQITTATNDLNGLTPLRIYLLLSQLSKSNNLIYLHPSFGYYFEQFYQVPHGLTYTLKPLPEDTLLPPPLNPDLIAENLSFWDRTLDRSRSAIEQAAHPVDYTTQPGLLGWIMMHLHVRAEPNPNALVVGTYYSRSLDYLGVQVQRAGELEKAAALFRDAQDMNTNNVVAGINLAFNQTLRAGRPTEVNLSRVSADQFGEAHNWNEVLAAYGPFDETSFLFQNGTEMMQAGLTRQAADAFHRVSQLAPDNLAARLFLAQIYIFNRLPDKAMEFLQAPLTQPSRFALTEFNSTELNVLAAAVHFQKNQPAAAAALLESEIVRHPDNETLMLFTAQSFIMHRLYTNALFVINRKLARTPDDAQWTYGKGVISLQVGDYNAAVAALNRTLEMDPNNPDALYNRGYAYFESDRLDAARADFDRLQHTYSNNVPVAYGLGEIAWRQHQTNEALRNYQIFAAHAPTNSAELKTVRERLTQLGVK